MNWKKFILLTLAGLVLGTSVCSAGVTPWDITENPNNSDWWSGNPWADTGWNWMKSIDDLVGVFGSVGTGDIYYVDSNVTKEGNGKSWTSAKDTLDEAINLCTASNGDRIYVAQGHAESYTAANGFDADVAGITIIGLGTGTLTPTFTFADTDATVAIGAANVNIVNLRFLAGISEVVSGVIVEAAGDNLTLAYCTFPEPLTSTFEFDEAITVAAGADGLTVVGCLAYSADDTGASSWLDLTAGVNNNTQIIGNTVYGEFATAAIISDKADLETYIRGGEYTNITTGQLAIEFTAAATGWINGVKLATDDIGTSLDPGSMSVSENTVWDDIDVDDVSAVPVFTNNTGVNRWGVTELAQMQAEAVAAVVAGPSLAIKVYADLNGYDTAAAFTVTGDVRVRVIGVVGSTAITSTSGTTTLSIGTTEVVAEIIAATTIDNSDFIATDVWTDNDPSGDAAVMTTTDWVIIGGGADVILTRNVDDLTAGTLTLYCWWYPLSTDGNVVAP